MMIADKMIFFLNFIISLPRRFFSFLIFLYQKLFSPDHSFWGKAFWSHGYCKFYPSCSEYGRQVVKKRGVFVGILKIGWRVLRCNPWGKGGVDLP